MDFNGYKFHEAYRKDLHDYFEKYEWEWFCSLNLAGQNSISADSYVKRFAREIGKREHIQVCFMGVKVSRPQLHVHLLMSGLDRYGHTLADRDKYRSERLWEALRRGSAVIEYVYDSGAVNYISFCNTPPESFELIEPYGLDLLEKKRLFKADPTMKPRKVLWHPYEYENLSAAIRVAITKTEASHSSDEPEEIFEEPIP